MTERDLINQLMAQPEYGIHGSVIDKHKILLFVSEFNDRQKEIPKVFGNKEVRIVREIVI